MEDVVGGVGVYVEERVLFRECLSLPYSQMPERTIQTNRQHPYPTLHPLRWSLHEGPNPAGLLPLPTAFPVTRESI